MGNKKLILDKFKPNKIFRSFGYCFAGFYKQLPEPMSSEELRRLQYRRKSDSVKKRVKQNFANIW